MSTKYEKAAVETVLGIRCPCGHLANRHRKADPAFRVGDFVEKYGACRDCKCRGQIIDAEDAA